MEAITKLTEIDFIYIFVSVLAILAGMTAVMGIAKGFAEKFGLEFKWMRKKREEHELLLQTAKNLSELQQRHVEDMEKSNECNMQIRNDLKQLKDIFIDTKIDTMRWEINDFASRVANNSRCNKDSYVHCIKTYGKYEKLLKDNDLKNGEVEISIGIIKESYAKKLVEGF